MPQHLGHVWVIIILLLFFKNMFEFFFEFKFYLNFIELFLILSFLNYQNIMSKNFFWVFAILNIIQINNI
jgi:hypothetical protein